MSVSQQAKIAQTSSGYAVDAWIDMVLQPMTKLWQGIGGPPGNFFFSEEDAREAKGAYQGSTGYGFAETLWRLAQVKPSRTLSYRQEIAEFVVDLPTPAAVGICSANRSLGSGSVFQYFIPGWQQRLHATGRTFKFGAKAYG